MQLLSDTFQFLSCFEMLFPRVSEKGWLILSELGLPEGARILSAPVIQSSLFSKQTCLSFGTAKPYIIYHCKTQLAIYSDMPWNIALEIVKSNTTWKRTILVEAGAYGKELWSFGPKP